LSSGLSWAVESARISSRRRAGVLDLALREAGRTPVADVFVDQANALGDLRA
jgi:hypothetical protein